MTVFSNTNHYGLFMVDDRLGNAERARASDMIISALISSGVFDGKFVVAAAAPADTTKIWVDTNSSPAVVKYWTGAAWATTTFSDIWSTTAAASDTVAGVVELATTVEAVAGTDTARAVTPAGLQAGLDALVAAAPGTLDTLNELAAALGDDPNFATTMTTALAGKVDSTRILTAGSGLTGGGDLSADRTFAVDINGLTAEAAVDASADFLMMYDTSVGALRKVLPSNLGATSFLALSDTPAAMGTAAQFLRVNAGATALEFFTANATDIAFTPVGNIAATTVAAALAELDNEKLGNIDTLTIETVFDQAADYIPFYDASAAAMRRITLDEVLNDTVIPAGSII